MAKKMDKNNTDKFYHEHLGVFCKGYKNHCDCKWCKKEFAESGKYPSEYRHFNTERKPKETDYIGELLFGEDLK